MSRVRLLLPPTRLPEGAVQKKSAADAGSRGGLRISWWTAQCMTWHMVPPLRSSPQRRRSSC